MRLCYDFGSGERKRSSSNPVLPGLRSYLLPITQATTATHSPTKQVPGRDPAAATPHHTPSSSLPPKKPTMASLPGSDPTTTTVFYCLDLDGVRVLLTVTLPTADAALMEDILSQL